MEHETRTDIPDMSNLNGSNTKPVGPTPGNTPPTSPTDLGDGTSDKPSSVEAVRYTISEMRDLVENVETLGFTKYQSLHAYPSDPIAQDLPSAAGTAPVGEAPYDTSGTESAAMRMLIQAEDLHSEPRPASFSRGTNILIPFGAATFVSEIAAGHSKDAIAVTMSSLTSSITTPGCFREIQNWKRVNDLKGVVISYFNRSIPFTDLSATERFLIEFAYSRELGSLHLPFRAIANVYSYYKWLEKRGQAYDTSHLTALYDATLQSRFIMLYKAIANFRVVDEVLHDRIEEFGKLRVSCSEGGYWNPLLRQNVEVTGFPSGFSSTTSNAAIENSKYICDYRTPQYVDLKRIAQATSSAYLQATPQSLFEWEVLFESGDLEAMLAHLDDAISRANQIKNNYAIYTDAQLQLAAKKSVEYKLLAHWLPVKAAGEGTSLCLTFDIADPTFSGAWKERIEYAPVGTYAEEGGSNRYLVRNLFRGPWYQGSGYKNITYSRPVGAYHGRNAFTLGEIINIGIFRDGNLPAFEAFDPHSQDTVRRITGLSGATVTEIRDLVTPDVNKYGRNVGIWLHDAFTGDGYYAGRTLSYAEIASEGTSLEVNLITQFNPIITFDSFKAINATKLHPEAATGATMYHAPTQAEPWLYPHYTGGALATPTGAYIAAAFSHLLNQLDLTNVLLCSDLDTGASDVRLYLNSGYQGTVWTTFDITLVDNVLETKAALLSLPVALKNTAT